jgi:hypothetical protein
MFLQLSRGQHWIATVNQPMAIGAQEVEVYEFGLCRPLKLGDGVFVIYFKARVPEPFW